MRLLPILLTIVAAAAAIGLVLLRSSPRAVGPDLDTPISGDLPAESPTGLVGRAPTDGPAGPPASGRDGPAPVDIRTVERGDLTVVLVDAEGERIPTDGVDLEIERIGLPFPGRRLAHRDIEARTWTFRGEPVGPVRVKAMGRHFRDAVGEAKILAQDTPPLVITVEPAGAVQVRTTLGDGSAPSRIHATLTDEAGKPVEAWWQERNNPRVGPRVRGVEASFGAEGWITGLAAGRYRVDIESEAGYRDKAWVDVTPGATAAVSFTLPQ
ncbi:MAG: hypothetical protein AB7T63_03245 [Planctomycetota bacterium]